MGLDIYFHKTNRARYEQYEDECNEFAGLSEEEKEKGYQAGTNPGNTFEPEEIGYFRKVNLLMTEFAYYGNCEYKEITKEELERLKTKCEIVLLDHDKAEELLPTCSGFFFGNTEYDEWYFQDVQEVFEWVCGVLDDLKDDEVVLMYCWW